LPTTIENGGGDLILKMEEFLSFSATWPWHLHRAIWHTTVHHSSTSTYTPNFIRIGETFCGRADVRTDIETGFIRSTQRNRTNTGTRPKVSRSSHGRVASHYAGTSLLHAHWLSHTSAEPLMRQTQHMYARTNIPGEITISFHGREQRILISRGWTRRAMDQTLSVESREHEVTINGLSTWQARPTNEQIHQHLLE